MKFLKFIAVFFATQSFSQTIGTTYLRFSGGYEKNGFTASASIDTHTSVNSFLRFGLEAQIEKYKFQGMDIPVKLGLFNTSYYQRIFSLDMEQTYNFYLGGGLVAGYEYLNDGDKFLPNNSEFLIKSQFIYGLNAGAQMDIYLLTRQTSDLQNCRLLSSFLPSAHMEDFCIPSYSGSPAKQSQSCKKYYRKKMDPERLAEYFSSILFSSYCC